MGEQKRDREQPSHQAADPASRDAPPVDQDPEVAAAADAMRAAREHLGRAEQVYHDARQKAAEQIQRMQAMSVGEAIDAGVKLVRRYPLAATTVAAAAGYLCGRIRRR